ncbi:MAG: nucleotidyltransferase family protein [Pseudomonadota bacterium]
MAVDQQNKINTYTKRVSVVVLAAGMSTRMGSRNKLLLDIHGKPLIRRTLDTLLAHDFQEVVVVLGHQYEAVHQEIADLDINVVYNPNYEEGQMTSVHIGLQHAKNNVDGVMIFLSDLALIDASDLNALRGRFDDCTTDVLAPTFKGQRGNPIILASKQIDSIINGDKNLGCKRLITKHPELVSSLPMSNDHVVVDMDTPDAYQQVLLRTKQAHQTQECTNG